ncbi:MAG: DoxX family membrane protein [Bacteroidia bacterium]|nr:DoxX family membrane protein [Bacteroidia bacterium]MCZ2249618.1 DoxX family protein [Bacteroidia bacterium]
MKNIVLICRLLVGGLFIISGLIKANDAVGFSYKLAEYFEVFGMEWLKPTALVLAMLICIFEVLCGVTTLTGTWPKLTSWALMAMIVFFTFLTFYSAYFNKVTDCGCFGDALKLTPWGSFTKDIVLLIFIIPIFLYRNHIKSFFSAKGDKIVLVLTAFIISSFTIYTYRHLPVIDFRPYAIGKNIQEGMKLPPGAKTDSIAMIFIYEKDGQRFEFSPQEIGKADSTYTFVDRIDKVVRQGDKPPIHDFSISKDGSDYTEDILDKDGYTFLLVCYNINKTDKDVFAKKINPFVEKCDKAGIPVIGMTASIDSEVEAFRHEVQAAFDFYTTDETTLKTIIRSNPGLVLLKKGTVLNMWHYNDFPTFDEFVAKHPLNQ